jgi:hypothetical protein
MPPQLKTILFFFLLVFFFLSIFPNVLKKGCPPLVKLNHLCIDVTKKYTVLAIQFRGC